MGGHGAPDTGFTNHTKCTSWAVALISLEHQFSDCTAASRLIITYNEWPSSHKVRDSSLHVHGITVKCLGIKKQLEILAQKLRILYRAPLNVKNKCSPTHLFDSVKCSMQHCAERTVWSGSIFSLQSCMLLTFSILLVIKWSVNCFCWISCFLTVSYYIGTWLNIMLQHILQQTTTLWELVFLFATHY